MVSIPESESDVSYGRFVLAGCVGGKLCCWAESYDEVLPWEVEKRGKNFGSADLDNFFSDFVQDHLADGHVGSFTLPVLWVDDKGGVALVGCANFVDDGATAFSAVTVTKEKPFS